VASIPGAPAPAAQTPAAQPGSPAIPPAAGDGGAYTVQEGDNFWTIAAAQVENKLGRTPTNAEIAPYWELLIEANRANISSGDPSLIFPGEQFTLPPVP
jgi:nucleoid-associated protein YgaU